MILKIDQWQLTHYLWPISRNNSFAFIREAELIHKIPPMYEINMPDWFGSFLLKYDGIKREGKYWQIGRILGQIKISKKYDHALLDTIYKFGGPEAIAEYFITDTNGNSTS